MLIIRQLDLDRNEAMVGMLFGVFIDIDHLLGIPDFVNANGAGNLANPESLLNSGVQWKSTLHNPIAILVVAPASIAFRFAIPLSFWGIHVLMDTVQIEYLGIASVAEILLIASLFIVMMWTELRLFNNHHHVCERSARKFVSWELGRISWVLNSVNPIGKNKIQSSA
ncbi:MAG: hypothetical protein LUQ14_04365 [Methanomassiliicoccales archaeon]|nr:hypothetical protein [Methanomassiliicoccales archaeon]